VVLVFAFVLCINAHAVLRVPTPFNTNPTTTGPCGVSTISDSMKSTAQATWTAGQVEMIVWNLVASDGGGLLKGAFDPLGGTDFSVPAWTTDYATQGSNKFYNHTFTVPADLNCAQSPTKLCSFKVNSGSWTSCTMVKICTTADCVAPPPPPKTCSPVTQPLTFCPNITGASLSDGYSPNDIDSELVGTFTQNLANPNVFATPTKANCPSLYKTFLCGLNLPSCNPKTGVTDSNSIACKSQCQETMKTCGLTKIHKDLYDCDSLPNCIGAATKPGGMSPGGAAVLSIFLIGLVATLAIFGFIYYKKGQLFGYMYDKDLHKIVKVSNPHNYTAYVDPEYRM